MRHHLQPFRQHLEFYWLLVFMLLSPGRETIKGQEFTVRKGRTKTLMVMVTADISIHIIAMVPLRSSVKITCHLYALLYRPYSFNFINTLNVQHCSTNLNIALSTDICILLSCPTFYYASHAFRIFVSLYFSRLTICWIISTTLTIFGSVFQKLKIILKFLKIFTL